ncbi:MAG: gamma-glutamyltransferase, partial [Clostridia bacterium]|nr:gamma-glutamyltransferase [Clostridia bacterium]
MERRNTKKKKNNRGLAVFIALALVVVIGLGAALYLPKLLKNPDEPNTVTVSDEPISTVGPSGEVIVVTSAPSLSPDQTEGPENVGIKNNYAVSCSNPLATAIGLQVLENGGNAVDAAVAVCFALGVLEPYASGIGGGGGMLVYDPATDTSK